MAGDVIDNFEEGLTLVAAALRQGIGGRSAGQASFVLRARDRIQELEAQKDRAYNERNRVIAALAQLAKVHGYKVGIGGHSLEDESWDPEWRTIIFLELPAPMGQVSWHVHDSERHLFASLPPFEGEWDGHTTEEKYRRLAEIL